LLKGNCPDIGVLQIKMVHPSNPNRVSFQMYIPKLLHKKAIIPCFNVI